MAIAPGSKDLARNRCRETQRIFPMIAPGSKDLACDQLEGFRLGDCARLEGSTPQSMSHGMKNFMPQLFFSVLLSCDGDAQELTEKKREVGTDARVYTWDFSVTDR
jgi:hypothetical protein